MTTTTTPKTTYELLAGDGPVVQINGRWFITMGNAGFNLPRNNGRGWATRAEALLASTDVLLAHLRMVEASSRQQSATVTLESHRNGLVQWETGR